MSKFKNLIGMKFGRLLVISRAENKGHNVRWNCICDCGKKTTSTSYCLTSGRSKSCGCLGIENATKAKIKHGYTKTKLYKHWCNMKRRCTDVNNDNYKYYGARGIKVCDEWSKDFIKFKDWAISHNYSDNLSLERIDVNGNYEPQNCKWIPYEKQIRNRRNTIFINYKGITKPLIEWCEIYGIKYKLAHARYKKGWNFEKIFSK